MYVYILIFLKVIAWALGWRGFLNKNILNSLLENWKLAFSLHILGNTMVAYILSFNFLYLAQLISTQKIWFHLSHKSSLLITKIKSVILVPKDWNLFLREKQPKQEKEFQSLNCKSYVHILNTLQFQHYETTLSAYS